MLSSLVYRAIMIIYAFRFLAIIFLSVVLKLKRGVVSYLILSPSKLMFSGAKRQISDVSG